MRAARLRLAAILTALAGGMAAAPGPAFAGDCPPGALGTSRVLSVDAQSTPRVGLKSFPQTLPLADKEVVLTFDDGPFPATTSRVLRALADQCVKATFFLIGRNAAANPEMVRRIAAGGHTIGHHTWSHPILPRLREAAAREEIDRGIAADEAALSGAQAAGHAAPSRGHTNPPPLARPPMREPATPFFRFPGFASNARLLDEMRARNMVVFGADLWASDWNTMTPEVELVMLTQRLAAARKGIILLHDTKRATAAMLPAFLRWLKANGYRVVHVVAAEKRAGLR